MAIVEEASIPYQDGWFEIQVVALHKGKDTGPFSYLQGMRQGTLNLISKDPEQTEAARSYHRNKNSYADSLANAIDGPIDAVISPPSDHPEQAEFYRQAIVAKHLVSTDLTPRLSRSGEIRAGHGATLDEVIAGLSYEGEGDECSLKHIIIVDDTFATGTTVAAVIAVLRKHGLTQTCTIIVVCPLRLETSKKI